MSIETEIRDLRQAIETLTLAVQALQGSAPVQAMRTVMDAIPPSASEQTPLQQEDFTPEPDPQPQDAPAANDPPAPPAEIRNEDLIELARSLMQRNGKPALQHILVDEIGVGAVNQLKQPEQRQRFVQLVNGLLQEAA
ncbi:hypothetical protein U5801_11800 [Lamprobacter modestohalophilus]|uniref:hypothetical protein n=1 Tax=Lamprobacter modestohalophilus TaxID=1064514 RepID=UPI002ADEBD17|nr:hypothetical protein [Lamprobacter modestohalophilus]MEA1050488.1 hypothetical protein [Lamprobacter modestohalophilus]